VSDSTVVQIASMHRLLTIMIGMNFSVAEQRVALSSILRKYELSLPKDSIHKDGLVFESQNVTNSVKEMNINFTRRF